MPSACAVVDVAPTSLHSDLLNDGVILGACKVIDLAIKASCTLLSGEDTPRSSFLEAQRLTMRPDLRTDGDDGQDET